MTEKLFRRLLIIICVLGVVSVIALLGVSIYFYSRASIISLVANGF